MPYSLTVSIGYSCGNVYSEETIKKVFQEADKNMYKNKMAGKAERGKEQ